MRFFLYLLYVMYIVVPGTFDVGLLNLVKELRRVVLPVFGYPTNCIRFTIVFYRFSSIFLIPILLTLLVRKNFIFSSLFLSSSFYDYSR
jgi:hypothetical protein